MADPTHHQLQALQRQLEEARDEAQLHLLQLRQVQEELDHYRRVLQTTESLVGTLLSRLESGG